MPIDENTLEQLLHEEESSTLDFKRDQYPFDTADDKAKSELLKDILAFSNAWRRTTAYILIGVDEVRGGRSKIVGVKTHLDDAKLHQFVNSKVQRSVTFSYQPFRTENMEIGVIEIPIQERPFYLKKKFGKVNADTVYKRDGSSTAIATLDEVARMGAEQNFGGTPQLVLEWADIEKRVVLPSPHPVKSLLLEPLLPGDTFKESCSFGSVFDELYYKQNYNEKYFQEIIRYTRDMAFLKSFGLRLFNDSGTVGQRVRFVGSVTKDNAIIVLDSTRQPDRPHRNPMDEILRSTVPLSQQLRSDPDPRVRELDDRWEITIDFGDVRPREDIWAINPLFIGSINGITKLEGKLQGDNIPEPIPCVLEVSFEVKQRPMERSDVEPYLDDR